MNEDLQKVKQALTFLTGNFYKTLFVIIAAFLFVLLPILSFDAGLTDDERLHCEHGVRIMNYYLGTDTMAGVSPVDSANNWLYAKDPNNWSVNINIVGGDFDLITAVLYKYGTSHLMGEYESKHFFIAIMGAILFLFIGLITYRATGSWAAALIALLFAALCPRLVGHSLDNPKDIPLAAFFAFSLYQIILALEENLNWKWYRLLLLIVSFILAIDCRVSGLMLIFFFGLFTGIQLLQRLLAKEPITKLIKPALLIALVCIASYLGCGLLWPWAGKNPLLNVLISMNVSSHFNQFNSIELFEHGWINNDAIPWYFVPRWYYITFPLFFISGLLLFGLLAYWLWDQQPGKRLILGLLALSGLLPMALVAIQHSNIYDDARHLYFVFASLVPLAAIGWYYFFKRIHDRRLLIPAMVLCSMMAAEPLFFMLGNHPLEVLYFSPSIGGPKGAFKGYEMDYWGFSIRSAMNWIEQNDSLHARGRKTRVRLWYGEPMKLKYYADKSQHLEFVAAGYNSPNWDYWITMPVESKFNNPLLFNWPPQGTIHQIMVSGAPVCAILKNPLSTFGADDAANAEPAAVPATAAPSGNDVQALLAQGINLYNAKDYNKAVIAFKAALKADSSSQLGWNNLVATYNLLQMYEEAAQVGRRGLVLFPTFTLLKNNLKVSLDGLQKMQASERYYSGLSYNYYVQSDYEKSIKAAEMILKYNPKSAAAYNNICSANNALGRYADAKKACEKALELAPGDKLILNNLNFSKKGLGEK